MGDLRDRLVAVALEWQAKYGNAPSVTSEVAEYDAARLVGGDEDELLHQNEAAFSRGKGPALRSRWEPVLGNGEPSERTQISRIPAPSFDV
jgi:hypothetical protein